MNDKIEFTLGKAIIYSIFLLLLQVIVVGVVGLVYGAIYSALNPEVSPNDLAKLISSSDIFYAVSFLFSELIFLIFALRLKNKFKTSFKSLLDFKKINIKFLISIIFLASFYIIISSELENIFATIIGRDTSYAEVLINTAKIPGISGLFISIFVIALIPSFVEEILFRGIFQNNLSIKYGNKKALIITSIIFAILHINPTAIVSIFFISVILGYLYIKTKKLIYSIVFHFINNLLFVFYVRYDGLQIKGLNTSIAQIEHIDMYLLLPAIFFTLFFLFVIYKIKFEKEKATLLNVIEE